MGELLEMSPYSYHFNTLKYFGAWSVDPHDTRRENLYVIYKTLMTLVAFVAIFFLLADLYESIGDVQKTSWNLCVSTLFIGGLTKFLFVFSKFTVVNSLRRRLHEDAASRTVSEDLFVNDLALKEYNYLRIVFVVGSFVFLPIWLVTRYGGSRELPLPMRFPFDFDKENDLQYNLMFLWVGAAGLVGAYFVLQCELCMFSILIQITREYWILMKDISLLNDVDLKNLKEVNVKFHNGDINPILKKRKLKNYLKYIYNRQQTLIQYTKDFDGCYCEAFLVHLLTVTIVAIVIGIQLISMPWELSGYLSFQIGYTSLVICDAFLVCWFASRLSDLCYKVGEVAYNTFWYTMDLDIQKDLTMLIMRSQHPPRITSAKMLILNLNAFMHLMKNIYSWLTLFRELETNKNVA